MTTSHFSNIETILLKAISSSTYRIQVAVAWFVNQKLFDALHGKAKNGVKVELIIVNDVLNNRDGGLDFQELIRTGAKFHFAKRGRLMHHKFCVIDSAAVYTGSYNWTYAANRNHENLLAVLDTEVARSFEKQFELLGMTADHVMDIGAYLLANPPEEQHDLTPAIAEELTIRYEALKPYTDTVEQIRLLDEALQVRPAAELLQVRQTIYQTYARDLKEFCRRYPLILLNHAGENYRWTPELLARYANKIFCGRIQVNETVLWDYGMIKRFESVLSARASNLGTSFPSNENIYISLNEMQQLDYRIAQRYREKKERYPRYKDDHLDRDTPFFINKAFDGLGVPLIPPPAIDAAHYVWTGEAMSSSQHNQDFWRCFRAQEIPWQVTALEKVKQRSSYEFEILCAACYFTKAQLLEFKNILDWNGIARNHHLSWSAELFLEFKKELTTAKFNFSKNTSFPWTQAFIVDHNEALSFGGLSGNTSVPFTEEFILAYQKEWSYRSRENHSLSSNTAVPWSEKLLDSLKDRLDWDAMARNNGVPWNMHLIEKYIPLTGDAEMFIVQLSYNKTVWSRMLRPFLDEAILGEIAGSIPDRYHNLRIV